MAGYGLIYGLNKKWKCLLYTVTQYYKYFSVKYIKYM